MILAHDVGTSGMKSTLYTPAGELMASVSSTYPLIYGKEFEVEQNPEHWWKALCENTRNILGNVNRNAVECITFSGQMMGLVAVDNHGKPLRNALIWADQRAHKESGILNNRFTSDTLYSLTGNLMTPSYSAPKMWWFKRHEPELYERTKCFLQAKDFLIYKLTGQFVTDYSDASGTGLFDIHRREWLQDLLDYMEINPSKLPQVHASTTCIGNITHEAAMACGLSDGTKVVIGGADGSCAAMGAGVLENNDLFTYIGSSAWVASASDCPVFDPLKQTFNFIHIDDEKVMPIGTMQAAGTSFEWIRSITATNETNSIDWMNQQAETSPIGAKNLLFLPYLLGERSPIWDPHAKGSFVGLTTRHERGDLIRAVMEGVALNLKWIYESLSRNQNYQELWFFGGGANSRLWQQMMANMTGLPVHTPVLKDEITGMGAAIAGAVGIGELNSLKDAKSWVQLDKIIEPNKQEVAFYKEQLVKMQNLYLALKPFFNKEMT